MADSIDTLSLHIALVGLACLVGYGIQKTIILVESFIMPKKPGLDVKDSPSLGENFPLFPLCMVGGILVDKFLRAVNMQILVDHHCMQRVSGIALDYLICAVLCTMNLQAATGWPFATICFFTLNLVGFAWHFGCILLLAPKMLPDCWFERAIFEVGHSMGTTANGLILLKMVDPHSETAAPSAVAFKLFVHEPMMGMWVAFVVFSLKSAAPEDQTTVLLWAGASLTLMVGWMCLYLFYFRGQYKKSLKERGEFLMQQETCGGRRSTTLEAGAEGSMCERAEASVCEDGSVLSEGGIKSPKNFAGAEAQLLKSDGVQDAAAAGRGGSGEDESADVPSFVLQGRSVAPPSVVEVSDRPSQTDLGHMMSLSSQMLRSRNPSGRGTSRATIL